MRCSAVASYAEYGALSRRSRADLIAGARVEVAPYKEDPGDFVLWKPSTGDQPGWDSPWGRGRPGWHIECSAMSENTLGETFDIHGGGLDLIFPHHENEIAQSVCAHDGHPFARYWMHNGMLTVGGAKMAKSEGNFITVRDALAEVPGRGHPPGAAVDPLPRPARLDGRPPAPGPAGIGSLLSRADFAARSGLRALRRGGRGNAAGDGSARGRSEHAACFDPIARARRRDQPDQLGCRTLGLARRVGAGWPADRAARKQTA